MKRLIYNIGNIYREDKPRPQNFALFWSRFSFKQIGSYSYSGWNNKQLIFLNLIIFQNLLTFILIGCLKLYKFLSRKLQVKTEYLKVIIIQTLEYKDLFVLS